jgi:hypothetical protein
MAKDERISIKLSQEDKWIAKAVEEERKAQGRPSTNNMVIQIIKEYFKNKNKK